MSKKPFDYEDFKKSFASRLKESKSLLSKDGAMPPQIKEFLEEALAISVTTCRRCIVLMYLLPPLAALQTRLYH